MGSHGLISFNVIHNRLRPKMYRFTHHFFWFKLDLDQLKNYPARLITYNKRGLYSFYDSDHLKLGEASARENYIKFAKLNGLNSKVKNVTLYTQMRFLGYVFNPVSFILLEDIEGREYAIIEIGNTYNELKPYFVDNSHFNENGFIFKTKKHFYISPFIDHDSEMEFRLERKEDKINIGIEDSKNNEKILKVNFLGTEKQLNLRSLIGATLKSPFVTLQFIFFIHVHAFVLWAKGIRYFKKEEFKELQQGVHKWKV